MATLLGLFASLGLSWACLGDKVSLQLRKSWTFCSHWISEGAHRRQTERRDTQKNDKWYQNGVPGLHNCGLLCVVCILLLLRSWLRDYRYFPPAVTCNPSFGEFTFFYSIWSLFACVIDSASAWSRGGKINKKFTLEPPIIYYADATVLYWSFY